MSYVDETPYDAMEYEQAVAKRQEAAIAALTALTEQRNAARGEALSRIAALEAELTAANERATVAERVATTEKAEYAAMCDEWAERASTLEAQLVAANKRIAALETVVMYARRCEAECPHWRPRTDGVIRTANLHNSLVLLDEQCAAKPEGE